MRPLEGLRVIELSHTLAGSFAAVLLADFGAEVILIEEPKGHPLRQMPPFYNHSSLLWAVEARNKKSLTLDLTQPTKREELLCLVRGADLLVEDLGPGGLEELGLSHKGLQRDNPGLILLRISPFGQFGPYRDRPGGDRIAQAMGGLTYVTGTPNLPPVSCGVAYASYLAGALGALASLIALYWRDVKGGEGQEIDLALYEAILRISEFTVSGYDKLGIIRERTGNTLPQSVAPGDCYLTKDDRWVVLTTVSDVIFARLAKAMGREELASDPRFSTGPKRVENGTIIEAIVKEWVRQLTLEQVINILNQAQVPVNAVYDVAMVFQDPHIQARRNILEVPSLNGDKIKMVNVVPRLSHTPGEISWAGPPLGYHDPEIASFKSRAPKIFRKNSPVPADALSGIRILEPATMGAGPFGPTLLSEFGAEVIKLEIPGQGESVRRIPPLVNGQSLFWADLHRNKKDISLDLRKPQGQILFKRLVQHSDVVLENFRPGTFEKWGFSFDELSRINPRIILVRVSGYGQDGPYSTQPGFDRIGLAFSGLMHLTGYPEGPPLRVGLAACDWLTGVFNAFGTMLALYWRDGQGSKQGQVIDLSLYESVLRIQEATIPQYDKLNTIPVRQGNRHPSCAPGDNYRAKDGRWVAIFVPDDEAFVGLTKAIGREDLLIDPRFQGAKGRRENQEELESIMRQWVANKTGEEVVAAMIEVKVPACLVYNAADIISDPQIAARNNLVEIEIPGVGKTKTVGVVPKLSLTPGKISGAGPSLSQDNQEIYQGLLGLQEEEIERLKHEGVI
jgi:formyl-CoA transferase